MKRILYLMLSSGLLFTACKPEKPTDNVTPNPVAKFQTHAEAPVNVDFTFVNESEHAQTFEWSVTTPATIENPTAKNAKIKFPEEREYTVTLKAMAPGKPTSTVSHKVMATTDPVANFLVPTTAPYYIGDKVLFENKSLNGATSFIWKVNGTEVPALANSNMEFTFNTAGAHEVSLVAKKGNISSAPFAVTIAVEARPVVTADFDLPAGNSYHTEVNYTFTNKSSANSTSWNWTVKNSSGTAVHTATTKDLAYKFTAVGAYTVELVAKNGNIISPAVSKPIQIALPPLTADFDYSLPSTGFAVLFTNRSQNAESYEYEFPDGNSGQKSAATEPQLAHYLAPGRTYTIKITARRGTETPVVATKAVTVTDNSLKLYVPVRLGDEIISNGVVIMKDLSGGDNHLQLFGGANAGTGRFGDAQGSLNFNGTTSVAAFKDNFFASNTTDKMTISFFIKAKKKGGILGIQNDKWPGSGVVDNKPWLYYLLDQNLGSRFYELTPADISSGGANNTFLNLSNDTWDHITLTMDGTTITLIKTTGTPASVSRPGKLNYNGMKFAQWGATWDDVLRIYDHFEGQLDDIRIFNRVLSVAEIMVLKNESRH